MRRNVDGGAQWKLRAGSPAVSRRRRRVRRNPSLLSISIFLFFYFLFFTTRRMLDRIPPFEVFLFLSFLKLVFLETETKIKQDMISQVIWTFLLFSPAYFYIFGEKGDLERIPSFLSCTILLFLHNLLFHLRFALWTYILWPIAFPVWRCKKKLHAKKDKVYLLIVCGSFALTKSPCNPPFEFWKSSSTWPEEWGPPLCNHCIAVHRSKKLCIIIKVLHFNWS